MNFRDRLLTMLIGAILAVPFISLAQDWFQATGIPVQRSAVSSAEFRTEFSSIETAMDKLPTITGNGGKIVSINAGGTALETIEYTTGTFEAVWSNACTTSPSQTWNYRLIGAAVFLTSPSCSSVDTRTSMPP